VAIKSVYLKNASPDVTVISTGLIFVDKHYKLRFCDF